MSEIKVNSIKGVAASSAAISINNTDGTCTANLTNRTNRRLTINGAMTIAQRGSSSTSTGYQTVDRFVASWGGHDEAPTQAQVDVASGTTPYTLGFRKAFRITNGNQTSGAGASDLVYYEHIIEAQDIANSGWNYTSSSSNITLSFWVKSSVSQDFKGYLRSVDGTSQIYPFSTGTLSADTWTKITKTISGNSNLTFDNNNDSGLIFYLWPYLGTTYTDAGVTENAWAAYASGTRTPDNTTTWYTTNDATFELTGVQLEVGSVATDFEHRSFGQELALCQRYFYMHTDGSIDGNGSSSSVSDCFTVHSSTQAFTTITPPVTMRSKPTLYAVASSGYFKYYNPASNEVNIGYVLLDGTTTRTSLGIYVGGSFTAGQAILVRSFDANAKLGFSAEL